MRGELRVYLGAAPGVGKTFAMLQEGRRRRSRGADVVVGLVETHGRADTEELLDGLEVVPRRELSYRGAVLTELDTAAVLARRPQVALIDELAHTNVPESRNARRWQDVQELLGAGIHVITTVNVQHLESAHDVVEQITGVPQRETVPDEIVRRAEVQLVDMAPEALRRRMVRGNVLSDEGVDTALSTYFRVGNLTALREIALIWLADKVGDQLDHYRPDHEIAAALEMRQRIVVALSGGAEGDTLLRRAAGFAARTNNAGLVAIHVTRSDGLAGTGPDHLARQRDLVESMGGSYHQVLGDDIPTALLEFCRGVNATQLVVGASRRGRLARLSSPGVGATTAARSASIDVHVVAHEYAALGHRRSRQPGSGVPARRRLLGFTVMAAGLPLLTLLLANLRTDLQLPSDLVLFLAAVVGIAVIGGLYPAVATALASALLLNYFFTPPLYEFAISSSGDVVALIVAVAVAVAVSVVVDRAARRSREAAAAAADAETLSMLAGSVLRGHESLAALLDQVRETFAMASVALLERADTGPMTPHTGRDPARWRVAAAAGQDPCPAPEHGDAAIPVDDDLVLVLSGRPLAGRDRKVLETAAVQAGLAFRQQRLASQAEQAVRLGEADRMRRALLSAVSHDLRTPLASATAAVDSLAGQIIWTPEQRGELLTTAQESLARLRALVENLLDMSSLQADALGVTLRPIALDEAVPRALDDVTAAPIGFDIPATLPEVNADPALLERVLVNLLGNAVRHSPPHTPPHLTGSTHGQRIELRIIDHGPGIPATDRDAAFRAFQRLGDNDNTSGIGLGLALSRDLTRDLTEAMGGTLTAESTPGGGLTMILALPAATRREQLPNPADWPR